MRKSLLRPAGLPSLVFTSSTAATTRPRPHSSRWLLTELRGTLGGLSSTRSHHSFYHRFGISHFCEALSFFRSTRNNTEQIASSSNPSPTSIRPEPEPLPVDKIDSLPTVQEDLPSPVEGSSPTASTIVQKRVPPPDKELDPGVNKVVSISLSGPQVSWCCLQRTRIRPEEEEETDVKSEYNHSHTLCVLDWHQEIVPYNTRTHFLVLMRQVMEVVGRIPKASLYLFEEFPSSTSKLNPYVMTFQLHLVQKRSYLLASLMTREPEANVTAIKTVEVAKLFNIIVGREKVSGQHLVDDMVIWKPLPSLIVPEGLKAQYNSSEPSIKEGLANSILLNLAYWKKNKLFDI